MAGAVGAVAVRVGFQISVEGAPQRRPGIPLRFPRSLASSTARDLNVLGKNITGLVSSSKSKEECLERSLRGFKS